ncbi:MAG: multiprotein-bridging factor 1 family protein, partial [Acidimicrobiia bacterium]
MSESNFGELVKEHRLSLRLSIKELAERVGRSEATIRNWERGETRPVGDEVF